ncbi:hypothetical protein B0T24DRAFT_506498, partial [Lasiosphaeria ovina]
AARVSDFSCGRRERYAEGYVNGTSVEAFPDSGADVSFISPRLVAKFGLTPLHGQRRDIHLPNSRSVISPGMVEIPWVFKGENALNTIQCWIFPGSIHDLVLGKPFLRISETLTRFKHRIKSRLAGLSRRLRLRLLGQEQQRLWGLLNGQPTLALPDTGSDVMLVSRKYARELGLTVDWDVGVWLEVEYADGSTGWTSGVARSVPWTLGSTTILCDFHVLDDLCVDVVLSNNYLFDMDVFSTHQENFLDMDSEEDILRFCGIRLLHKATGELDSDLVADVTSPDAFGPSMMQTEWATRDRIRDEISALPEDQRDAARQAEAERQRQWEELRQGHQLRWKTLPQA